MLTGINSVNSNSNQEIIESYLHGYRNGCEHAKVKLIEAATEWLENNIENYVTQANLGYVTRVDSDVYYSNIYSNLVGNFKSYLMSVLVD